MTADTTVRPDKPMSEDDLATALAADLEDAAMYADTELGPLRAAAIHYYRSGKFGDEEDGRSQVVMPIVRDTIRATLPSLMKKFFGSERVASFTSGVNPGDSQFAEQAMDAVEYVFTVQNEGFHVLWSAFKDALRCKTGWIKWWWDESIVVSARTFSGVTEQQLLLFEHTKLPGDEVQVVSKQVAGWQPGIKLLQQQQQMQSAITGQQPQPQPAQNAPARETGEGLQIPGDPMPNFGMQEGGTGGQHNSYDAYGNYQPNSGEGAYGVTSTSSDASGLFAGAQEEPDGSAVRDYSLTPPKPQAAPPPGMVPVYTYTVRIVSKKPKNQIRVQAVPPDEVIFPHDAWNIYHSRLLAHRTRKTRGELVAMGVDPDDLESIPSDDMDQLTNLEFLARQTIPSSVMTQSQSATWDQVRVPYYECYYRVDADGDGISELRKICRIGKTGKIVSNEIWDDVPFAMLCPDPEPHVIVGFSQADNVMDIQNVESHVWRDLLDSLKQSIFPRMAYVEGQANLDDVLNSEIGAAIRMRQPGMVQPLTIPFTGQNAFPMLDKLAQVREQRTGIGQAAMALDGSALQSTTPVAAQATVQATQAQVEMIARLFAEYGAKHMFRGIMRLLVNHQDQPMQIQLNGRAWQVNPAQWNPDMHAIVDTGLGQGTNNEKLLEALDGAAKAQLQLMQQLGPNNPLVSLQEYYNTVTKMLRLSGLRDTTPYFANPANAQKTGRQLQPPPPSPEMIKSQSDQAIEKMRTSNERLKTILQHDFEQDKLGVDAHLRMAEINAKYGTAFDSKLIDAAINRESIRSAEAIAQYQTDNQPTPAPGGSS